jgi:hypothetical protein
MTTRLVDVLNTYGNVLHTFPITLKEDEHPSEDAFMAEALEAAAYSHLVPEIDLQSLNTKMHISRGGPLEPYGDSLDSNAGTKAGLDQEVRNQAYSLWNEEGCPDGQAEKHWYCALEQNRRDRAYMLWHLNGCPEGNADADWQHVVDFEKQ